MIPSFIFGLYIVRIGLIAGTYMMLERAEFYRDLPRHKRRTLCLGCIAVFLVPIEILSLFFFA